MIHFLTLTGSFNILPLLIGGIIVAAILIFLSTMFGTDKIDDIEDKIEEDGKVGDSSSTSQNVTHPEQSKTNNQGRLILTGHIIKSLYNTILLVLFLISPLYYILFNYPQFFIEHIENSLEGIKVLEPANPELFNAFLTIINGSRNLSMIIITSSVLLGLLDISKLLINSSKVIDENSSIFKTLIKKVRRRQFFIRILLLVIITITFIIALN